MHVAAPSAPAGEKQWPHPRHPVCGGAPRAPPFIHISLCFLRLMTSGTGVPPVGLAHAHRPWPSLWKMDPRKMTWRQKWGPRE